MPEKEAPKLSKRTVDALFVEGKDTVFWDRDLTGFGIRVQPSGLKSFLVNYRGGDGGRKAPNKRVVIARYGRVAPDQARRLARKMLGKVADGEDPAGARASARRFSTLREAFHDYMKAKPHHSRKTNITYRRSVEHYLVDWLSRPLDSIERREVEERFILLTENHGWALANLTISLLRSIYRRPCVDNAGLRNPVDLWLASGGRFNPVVQRRISSPSEVLPCWRRGIKAAVTDPMIRDIFWIGMYSGMRLGAGLVFCPPAEHREPMSGLAIPFSMWQCAGHGDAAGPGFVRLFARGHGAPDLGRAGAPALGPAGGGARCCQLNEGRSQLNV